MISAWNCHLIHDIGLLSTAAMKRLHWSLFCHKKSVRKFSDEFSKYFLLQDEFSKCIFHLGPVFIEPNISCQVVCRCFKVLQGWMLCRWQACTYLRVLVVLTRDGLSRHHQWIWPCLGKGHPRLNCPGDFHSVLSLPYVAEDSRSGKGLQAGLIMIAHVFSCSRQYGKKDIS